MISAPCAQRKRYGAAEPEYITLEGSQPTQERITHQSENGRFAVPGPHFCHCLHGNNRAKHLASRSREWPIPRLTEELKTNN
ncbi:unnamed protein product, partial [Nesidiocoris tenuis]